MASPPLPPQVSQAKTLFRLISRNEKLDPKLFRRFLAVLALSEAAVERLVNAYVAADGTFDTFLRFSLALDPGQSSRTDFERDRASLIFLSYDNGSKGHLNFNDQCELVSDLKTCGCEFTTDSIDEIMRSLSWPDRIFSVEDLQKYLRAVPNSFRLLNFSTSPFRDETFPAKLLEFLPSKRDLELDSALEERPRVLIRPKVISLDLSAPPAQLQRQHSRPIGLEALKKVGGDVLKLDPDVVGLEMHGAVEGHILATAETVIDRMLLTPFKKPKEDSFDLLTVSELLRLCNGAREYLLTNESSLVELRAPVKIFGDVHGQIKDLLHFFQTFGCPNHRTGDANLVNYVFLGDFVDRGWYSLEVVSLLFALKLRYPKRIFLVRGNHESRDTNGEDFLRQCVARLGTGPGCSIWEACNRAFDCLPLGALIENAILCVHGGVGKTFRSLDQIRQIKRPWTEEEFSDEDRQLFRDILWSDPTDGEEEEGLFPNPERGEHIYKYGPDVVRDFCKNNKLRMIVRAHQVVMNGFELFAGGHLITIFSATKYCDSVLNDGAYLEVNPELEITPKTIKCVVKKRWPLQNRPATPPRR